MTQEREPEPTAQKERRVLACRLTQAEFNVRATEFAQIDEKIDALEAEKKATVDDYKDRIGGLNAERAKLRRAVMQREEPREVWCTWHADWASKSMLLRRDDTNEVVQVRTMTAEEVQASFDYTDKSNLLPERTEDSEPLDG